MNRKLTFILLIWVNFLCITFSQRIVSLDRDNRCSGQVIFQRKPADPDDFGNFLNSTSFSEIDCAVKCYQRVPNCRGVRYDHVSNICMYSNKDQGNCFRSPKDDPVVLQGSRMVTMYCIQCIERNTTRTAATRKVQPDLSLLISTTVAANSQITNSTIKNINAETVLQASSQLLQNQLIGQVKSNAGQILPPAENGSLQPVPQAIQAAAFPAPSFAAPGAQSVSGSLPQSQPVPQGPSLPQVPLAPQASVPVSQPKDKIVISDDNSTEFDGEEWVDEVAKPNSTNLLKPSTPIQNGINAVPSLTNDGFPVPALFDTDSDGSSASVQKLPATVQQLPTVRKTNVLFPLGDNSGDIFANGEKLDNKNSSQSFFINGSAPFEATVPPPDAQVLHTFNETSGTFSNKKDPNITLPNTNPANQLQNVTLSNIIPANQTTSPIIEKKPNETAIPIIKAEQTQVVQPAGRITGQVNPINLASTIADPSCKDEDVLPCANRIGRDCIVVKPERCPMCFCPYRSPAKGCSGPNGLNEIVRNELIQGKRKCPNGETAQPVFRYQRKIDKDRKFDNCIRTVQPYCGVEQDLTWQMPRFVNDCYYYCYTDRELRERNFFNITTYD